MRSVYAATTMLFMAFGLASSAKSETTPQITVTPLNDFLLYFFDGRRPAERYSKEWNWYDDSAMKLGVGTYAIHNGDEAVVYDTFTSVPQAKFVRDYLEKIGIKKFTVVHSHWHLDHIAGDAAYKDSDVVSTVAAKEAIEKQKADIEAGKTWGPPDIADVRIPNVTFTGSKPMKIGGLSFELRSINIHSIDHCVIYFPDQKVLLAGDTVEDTLTYMVEVENLAEHIKNLKVMRSWDISKIYPNHGDPDVIRGGGYDKSIIDATAAYVRKVITKAHDANYLTGTMEDYIGEDVKLGAIHVFEPYREVHTQNLKMVSDYWNDKTLPAIGD